jgi:hypothetical protein
MIRSPHYPWAFPACLAGNKSAEALAMQFVSTPVLLGTADGLRTLALAHATGQLQLVPWDIYMGSDAIGSLPRYFGTREDYGAAYDLIQEHPELFNAASSMAEVGVLVNAAGGRSAGSPTTSRASRPSISSPRCMPMPSASRSHGWPPGASSKSRPPRRLGEARARGVLAASSSATLVIETGSIGGGRSEALGRAILFHWRRRTAAG